MMWKCLVSFLLIGVVTGRVYIPLSRRERIREAVEEECIKNGAPDKVEQAEKGTLDFVDCFVSHFDVVAYRELMVSDNEDMPEALIDFVKSMCSKKAEYNKCFDNFLDAVSPCMEDDAKTHLDTSKQMMENMTNYICDDDAKRFTDFVNDGALECFRDQQVPLTRCANQVEIMGNYKTMSVSEACTTYKSLTNCVTDALSVCPKPSTAQFLKTIFDDFYKGSRCTRPSENELISVNRL